MILYVYITIVNRFNNLSIFHYIVAIKPNLGNIIVIRAVVLKKTVYE